MSAIEILAVALHAACFRDLPDIETEQVDAASERAYLDTLSQDQRREYYRLKSSGMGVADRRAFFMARAITTSVRRRRPWPEACEVTMFRQTWPSTATGYGGIGGQAITSTETVVVRCDHTGWAAVYFGSGRLAYLVPPEGQDESWRLALQRFEMPSCQDAKNMHGWCPHVSCNISAVSPDERQQKDAERYRFIRSNPFGEKLARVYSEYEGGEKLDAAIDEAICGTKRSSQ